MLDKLVRPGGSARGPTVARGLAWTSALVAVGTVAAKAAGLVKEVATASRLGVGADLDAFVLAFAIPATLVALVVGPLATAFIPAFVATRQRAGDARAGALLDGALIAGTGVAAALAGVALAASTPLLAALGGTAAGARLEVAQRLLRWLVPMVVLQVPATLWSGVLNAHGWFALPALAPAALPLCATAALLLAPPTDGARGLAVGFTIGSAMQAILLAPAIHHLGWLRPPRWPNSHGDLRRLGAQLGPLCLGALVLGGMPVVDQAFAARLPAGSLSTLAYAEKLAALVNGVLSMSLATAVLPRLAHHIAAGDDAGAWRALRRGVAGAALVSLPLTLALWLGSHAIARAVFERGALDATAARSVGDVQSLFLLQIPFFAVGMVLSRFLSAAHRADLLLLGNLALLVANVVLDALLVRVLGLGGIALATSLVYALAVVLLALLCRRIGRAGAPALLAALLTLTLAACERTAPASNAGTPAPRPPRLDEEVRQAASEVLTAEQLSPVAGFAYSAELLLNPVPGLREGGSGRALRLVENDAPLGPIGALSADVVALGGGRFNHETRPRILFSTSDNSDPRTNGRTYRVEWDEPARVRSRTNTRVVGIGAAEDAVEIPTTHPIRARRLVVENLDPDRRVRAWGRRADGPDLTSREAIVAAAVRPGMTDEEKALALWRLVTLWRRHDTAAAAGNEAADPVKLLGVYGFGYCNDTAHALAILLQRAGLRARVVAWAQHTVVEVRYGGRWHLVDADRGEIFRLPSGEIASVAEVFARRPSELVQPWATLPIASASALLDRAYPRGAARIHHRPLRPAEHSLRPVLEPRDVVVVEFTRTGRFVDRFSAERTPTWPTSFATGTLRRQMRGADAAGCRATRVSWPYPIVSLDLTLRGSDLAPEFTVEVRGGEGEPWEEIRLDRAGDQAQARADAWLARGPLRYALEARVCDPSIGIRASAPARSPNLDAWLDVGFQLAPRTIPRVAPGSNRFVWTIEDPEAQSEASGRFAGIRVTHDWDELDASISLPPPAGSLVFELDRRLLRPDPSGAATWLPDQLAWRVPDAGAVRADRSRLTVYENGRALDPSDTSLAPVRERGRGRFAHRDVWLTFSASDGTSPLTNGRIYSVALAPLPAPSPEAPEPSRPATPR